MSYVYALIAALTVTTSETVFAQSPSWFARAWLFVPLAVVANIAIFKLVHSAPSLLDAFVIFSFVTMVLRVGSTTLILRQTISHGTWAAIALIALAKVTQSVWHD